MYMSAKKKLHFSDKKRWAAAFLSAALLCALLQPLGGLNPLFLTAYAASNEAMDAADELHELGLFQGTGTNSDGTPNYDLDRPMDRAEGITMMVRILGAEDEAKAGEWDIPFTDVPDWAIPYVGYAYANEYTYGTSDTTFGAEDPISAAQYTTMVLRALGYSSSTDFYWEHPWALSDTIGLTDGRFSDENNQNFLREDAVIVSAQALDVKPKNSEQTLREVLFADSEQKPTPGQNGPADYNTRLLSDAEIKALLGKSPAQLRKAISSFADAQAYMNAAFPNTFALSAIEADDHGYWRFYSARQSILRGSNISPNTYAACVTYLLSDNYEIYTIYGLRQECVYDSTYPVEVTNCIKTEQGYRFLQPCSMDQINITFPGQEMLPDALTTSLDEYAALISSNPSMADITALYAVKNGAEVTTDTENGWMVITEPGVEPFYTADASAWIEQYFGHIKAENINKYKLSSVLGGLTLSVEDAYALVDAKPEVVKEKVKTAADMLIYMLAARFMPRNGSEAIWIDGHVWNYNFGAEQNIADRAVNCGGAANLANYLLEGDYEEVGFIMISYYPGMGGGHVYNYFKYQGRYYIVDFSSYTFAYFQTESERDIIRVKTLAEYGAMVANDYRGTCAAVAFTSPGQHLPNVWEDNYYYLPAGSEYKVIYQANDGYQVGELHLDTSKLDWHEF